MLLRDRGWVKMGGGGKIVPLLWEDFSGGRAGKVDEIGYLQIQQYGNGLASAIVTSIEIATR